MLRQIDNPLKYEDYLDFAQLYADKTSGCRKVVVGSVVVKEGRMISFGANRAIPNLCRSSRGCLRVERYGEDSKSHRNPEDCRAIHSEIDALSRIRESAMGSTIFVTRYPCEGCAKAIIASGIKRVVYGGTARISPMTEALFDDFDVECTYIPDWKEDHSDR